MLDGESPFVRELDDLISHAFDAVPGGKLVALPYFAFRSKLVAYGNRLAAGLHDRVHGLGRYDRTQRLYAAHTVIVMTAFAEALGEMLDGIDLTVQHRADGSESQVSEAHGSLVLTFDSTELPTPWSSLGDVASWLPMSYLSLTRETEAALQTWSVRLGKTGSELPELAYRRYLELYRRLIAEAPEFAAWAYLAEHASTRTLVAEVGGELRARLDALTTGLAGVPDLLDEVSGRAAANRARAELARAYQAALERSVLGETRAPDGVVLPSLERGYVNPACRVSRVQPRDLPSEDGWWADQPRYDDLQSVLVASLTAADAVDRPLVVLGQPGAGKSVLTRMLAARLSDRGFLPVRVELRNVPADADVQTQIEHAVRDTTGRTITWPEIADSARDDGLLPLVILDGFDELLQATGVNRSDYLERVAEFQRREFDLGRPVAAIVTSRTAVADRMRFPDACVAIRLEPFDEARVATWLSVWNEANAATLAARGVAPLDPAHVLRFGELAEQPLLLTLLALYDADAGALGAADAGISRADLYERLLTEFARREVRKSGTARDDPQERQAVTAEMSRLEIVALAMINRHTKAVTGADLDNDLAALLSTDPPAPGRETLTKPLTAAQLTVGRFFFVHESRAVREGAAEHAYEFLHATFGEFLTARHVVEALRTLARDRAYFHSRGRSGPLDDGELWASLSFAALSGTAATIEFTEGLLALLPDAERASVRELTVELLADAQYPNTRRSLVTYEPAREPAYVRHAYYSANLTLLAILSTGEPLDFHPDGIGVWSEALRIEENDGMEDAVRVCRVPSERGYAMRIVREDGSDVSPNDTSLISGIGIQPDPLEPLYKSAALPAHSDGGVLIRRDAPYSNCCSRPSPRMELIVGCRFTNGASHTHGWYRIRGGSGSYCANSARTSPNSIRLTWPIY
jgi:hypothetical protein